MSELTVGERLTKLERFIYGGEFHLLRDGGLYEVKLANCPECNHVTIQVDYYDNSVVCLVCGHKLASRIVAID